MLPIEEYVVNTNPAGSHDFLIKWGMPTPVDGPDFVNKVKEVLTAHKAAAFADLAQVPTPYRDLILQFNKPKSHSNACGCSGANGKKSNCSGGCGCGCGSSGVDGVQTGNQPTDNAPAPQNTLGQNVTNLANSTAEVLKDTSNKIAPYVPLLGIALLTGIFVAVVLKD